MLLSAQPWSGCGRSSQHPTRSAGVAFWVLDSRSRLCACRCPSSICLTCCPNAVFVLLGCLASGASNYSSLSAASSTHISSSLWTLSYFYHTFASWRMTGWAGFCVRSRVRRSRQLCAGHQWCLPSAAVFASYTSLLTSLRAFETLHQTWHLRPVVGSTGTAEVGLCHPPVIWRSLGWPWLISSWAYPFGCTWGRDLLTTNRLKPSWRPNRQTSTFNN